MGIQLDNVRPLLWSMAALNTFIAALAVVDKPTPIRVLASLCIVLGSLVLARIQDARRSLLGLVALSLLGATLQRWV